MTREEFHYIHEDIAEQTRIFQAAKEKLDALENRANDAAKIMDQIRVLERCIKEVQTDKVTGIRVNNLSLHLCTFIVEGEENKALLVKMIENRIKQLETEFKKI